MDVRIIIDAREIKDSLAALWREGPRAIAEVIRKVAFEARLAVQDEIKGVFLFSGGPGGSTEKFLTNSVLFATVTRFGRLTYSEKIETTLYLRPGARIILDRQQAGSTIAASDPRVGPEWDGKIAVPNLAVVKRGRSGRILKSDTPAELLMRRRRGRTRGFLANGKIIKRVPGSGGRMAYALVDRAKLKPRFDFFGVAQRTMIAQLPKKAARVLEKINLRRGR